MEICGRNNILFSINQVFIYSISVKCGCTQGDINFPIIFNVIIDAVIKKWKSEMHYKGSQTCFYSDDGLLENVILEDM